MTLDEVVAAGAPAAAAGLLGWTLLRDGVGGRIVEVEAYDEHDPASHSFRGPTPRSAVMFGEPGRLYVYRSYGLHWCANVVCGPVGTGAAVLIRALEPTHGIEEMRRRRGDVADPLLCAGPGRLTQALGIDGADTGADLREAPFALHPPASGRVAHVTTPRIGITRAADRPWRFVEAGTRWASRALRA
jgi:DNA-3-methyladenine glycosylase